jgi:hypothetical protein
MRLITTWDGLGYVRERVTLVLHGLSRHGD